MNKYFIRYKAYKDTTYCGQKCQTIVEESTILEIYEFYLSMSYVKNKINGKNQSTNLKVIDILIMNKL